MITFAKTELKDIHTLITEEYNYTVVIENYLILDTLQLKIREKSEFKPLLDLLPHIGNRALYFEILITPLHPQAVGECHWDNVLFSLIHLHTELCKKHEVKGYVFKFSSNFVLDWEFSEFCANVQNSYSLIIEVTILMINQQKLLRKIVEYCDYWVLQGQGFYDCSLKPLESGCLQLLKPGSHSSLDKTKLFFDNCGILDLNKKCLLQLPTTGTKYCVYNEQHVLNIESLHRNECMNLYKLDPGSEQGTFEMYNDRRQKRSEEIYWDSTSQILSKLRYFIEEKHFAGVMIENLGFDYEQHHPDSIFQIVQRIQTGQLNVEYQNRANMFDHLPTVSVLQSRPKQPTLVSTDDDEKCTLGETDSTNPDTNAEIFEMG